MSTMAEWMSDTLYQSFKYEVILRHDGKVLVRTHQYGWATNQHRSGFGWTVKRWRIDRSATLAVEKFGSTLTASMDAVEFHFKNEQCHLHERCALHRQEV